MEGLAEVVTALRGVLASVQGPTVGVGVGELRAGVRGLQEVISAASAAQTVRIAQYAARDEQRTEEGVFVPVDRGVGHVNEFADDDQAPVLGMAPSMATTPASRRGVTWTDPFGQTYQAHPVDRLRRTSPEAITALSRG